MCLKAIALIKVPERNNKMLASQSSFFSLPDSNQNLDARRIFNLQQTLVEQSLEER